MPTLNQLISEQKSLHGYSYADLETRAKGVIRRQRWQQLGTGVRIKEFPEPSTIEAMATALDVDVAVVVLAAARSIGLDVKRGAQSDLAARLPYSANQLSEVQRDAIVTLVRSITEVPDVVLTDSSAPAGAPSEDGPPEKSKVRTLIPRDQGSDEQDDLPPIDLPAAARDEPGYTTSGKREESDD